jgi:hypothetical protein
MRPPNDTALNRTSPPSQRQSTHRAPTGKNSCRQAAGIVDVDHLLLKDRTRLARDVIVAATIDRSVADRAS